MDKILEGLLTSAHNEHVKKKLVEKITATPYNMPNEDWKLLCDFSYDLIKEQITPLHAEIGDYILAWIARCQERIYLDHFNSETLENRLTHAISSIYKNLRAVVKVIKHKNDISIYALDKETVERDFQLLKVLTEKYFFLCKGRHDWQILFVFIFNDLPRLIPTERNVVIQMLINGLANLTNESMEVDFVKKSVTLIEMLWNESTETISFSIREIFEKLTASSQCSNAIAVLIGKIPIENKIVILPYLQQMPHEDISRLEIGIQRMVEMMKNPDSKNIGNWIIELMNALGKINHDMLTSITNKCVPILFKYLYNRKSRENALLILKYMLLGCRGYDVFRTILTMVPDVLDIISSEDDQREILLEFSTLVQCLMYRFPGYIAQYDIISQKLESLKLPTVEQKEIMSILQKNAWNKMFSADVSKTTTPRYSKPKKKVGLQNLGNTCFMNSVLQALFNTAEFRRRILRTSRNRTSTLYQLQQCFQSLESDKSYISPSALLETLPKWLNNGRQQDCHEFLKQQLTSNKRQRLDDPNNHISFDQLDDNEIPISPFGGVLVNTIECLSCGTESKTKEEFHDLTLSLQIESSSKNLSFSDLLSEFFSPEKLNDDNQYHCEKCRGLCDALKTTRIMVPPKYLILSLNRFEYNKRYAKRIKIMTHVTIQETLSLSYIAKSDRRTSKVDSNGTKHKINQYVNGDIGGKRNGVNGNSNGITNGVTNGDSIDNDKIYKEINGNTRISGKGDIKMEWAEYDLSAIVIHSGSSAEYGHYYTYAKDEGDDTWWYFNDNFVNTTSLRNIISEGVDYRYDTPYLFFFRQKTMINNNLGQLVTSS
ncbi:3516_t:CDS:10 [Acaulospora morrowiae]|uniref:Ubiquitin carboxyl-terminal hydrolase n=1 Tax=Acaulospora morrowiae TaxID=94023 RepID=A0A9N9BGZ8_9GLOM|nr:3516_t:CDS:10 [Acaulospora morrowiae]